MELKRVTRVSFVNFAIIRTIYATLTLTRVHQERQKSIDYLNF
ncbi:hypothetical protein ACFQ44_01620 [Levilactobacillus lanxiensis]|uniref:Uncharacterized protein n=2 Tax=Lactobacillaceae TaxID=33958 RepID=A0ABW4D0X1_9LACO|nr:MULTISPECIES: hypothetical protein [Levilactobacillus]